MNTNWIDIPVVQALEYFSGVLSTFYKWGSHYAVLIGTVGLCWSAFKLINSKFTVREFWWNTFYKWLFFILLMNIYPLATQGLSAVANRMGIDGGGGKSAIISSLTTMKKNIEADIQTGIRLENEMNAELRNIVANTENISFETRFGNCDTYDEFINKFYDEVNTTSFNSKAAKKKSLELINEYREKNKYHSIFSKKTLKAIKDILVQKTPDGKDGKTLLNEYVDLNIWLYDKNGKETTYLSPSAIMRVTVLGCQILWEKNQLALAMNLDELDEEDANFMKKGFNKISATFAHIPTMLMCMFCCIVMVFCAIFACIQYLMAILEYTIITGIGAMFIPFILFDGTKELPKKLVPVFMGFFIKLIVINICLFYVFYLFIQETVDVMGDSGGMNWVTFVTVIFSCIIAFILTQNAPKIAQTIMTGQPQMSMGEFLAAAGTLAMGTIKGGKIAGKVATEGTRKVAQTAVNTKGTMTKAKTAMETAGNGVAQAGGTIRQQNHAAMKGMYASISGDLKDKFRNAGNNFLHGGSSSGGSGGGGKGIGPQAHQRSGQNTNPNIMPGDSRTINTTSNPKFQNATIYDPGTQSNINMTRKQFYEEKKQQGEDIGNEVLKKMDEKKKKDQ